MRFTVTWRPSAERDATELWLAARDQRVIAESIDRIDFLLSTNPLQFGEDFYGDRLLVVPPIHVTYRVYPDDCRVDVEQVWRA
jgi:hypothetical protein